MSNLENLRKEIKKNTIVLNSKPDAVEERYTIPIELNKMTLNNKQFITPHFDVFLSSTMASTTIG